MKKTGRLCMAAACLLLLLCTGAGSVPAGSRRSRQFFQGRPVLLPGLIAPENIQNPVAVTVGFIDSHPFHAGQRLPVPGKNPADFLQGGVFKEGRGGNVLLPGNKIPQMPERLKQILISGHGLPGSGIPAHGHPPVPEQNFPGRLVQPQNPHIVRVPVRRLPRKGIPRVAHIRTQTKAPRAYRRAGRLGL